MWFSLIRIASYSPARWFVAPPAATAAFSSARSPGVVLRVSSTRAPVPCTSRAARADSVATPDRCARKFSAVRSPVNSARARAEIDSTGPPCSRHTPSVTSRSKLASGSSAANAASAASRPKIVPGAFCVISALPRVRSHRRQRRHVARADVLRQRRAHERGNVGVQGVAHCASA